MIACVRFTLSQSSTAEGAKPSKMYACAKIVKKKYRQRKIDMGRA
jgi:hypothetical protein